MLMSCFTFQLLVIWFVNCYTYGYESDYNKQEFVTFFEWSYINFTWESNSQFTLASQRKNYIPENIVPSGIKFYQDRLYVALPKFRSGVPVTLASLSTKTPSVLNNLLTPYPDWQTNDDSICDNLQSVLSMEIDLKGTMYVIDGVRLMLNTQCPCKVILLDLNNGGRQIQNLTLPNEICLMNGGFLNDIVIDDTDGGFAYITDTSNIDPGIIIYSTFQNRAWKIRDQSMFSQKFVTSFDIEGYSINQLLPVDGIALSPKSSQRTLFFCSVMAYAIFGIDTSVLKNETESSSNIWRKQVQTIGNKQSQTDGMMMDSKGNLYYSLVPLYGVGKWNIFESFDNSEVFYTNKSSFKWTDGFGMDQQGNLYLMTNWGYKYFLPNFVLERSPDIKFTIHKTYTDSRSYLYNDVVE